MNKLTILEEARYRLACCRAETGDGWGDKHSLRNHLRCNVGPRLHELKPFVEEIEGLGKTHELHTDLTTVNLMYEYHDLVSVEYRIRLYLQVDQPRGPWGITGHHVLPLGDGVAELCRIIEIAHPGDHIHCSREVFQELPETEYHQLFEKNLTCIFPEPSWVIEEMALRRYGR